MFFNSSGVSETSSGLINTWYFPASTPSSGLYVPSRKVPSGLTSPRAETFLPSISPSKTTKPRVRGWPSDSVTVPLTVLSLRPHPATPNASNKRAAARMWRPPESLSRMRRPPPRSVEARDDLAVVAGGQEGQGAAGGGGTQPAHAAVAEDELT